MKKVPVLITFDVDPSPHLSEGIDHALDLLKENDIRATFFFVANHADQSMIDRVKNQGHEIGCHGLNHDDTEELHRLSEKDQRKILSEATDRLKMLSGNSITSFRSPRVKTSTTTFKILQELGYQVDSSVCSQRLDFFSSNLINPGWITAPRRPYYPNIKSPYRRGKMKIFEIPVSALILPFISTTLRIFGVTLMKLFFNFLYLESRITGKPIVYLVHPHEFTYREKKSFNLKMLIPNKTWRIRGFPLRVWLARKYLGPKVKEMNQKLFEWISKKKVKFLTVKDYANLN